MNARRGMTLIELLVVVGILLTVAALTVPRLRPMMDHSKIREAARMIQLYLSSARNQALASGRSCGVLIEPLPADNGCSTTLKMVEMPTPYGGDSTGSTVMTLAGTANGTAFPCVIGQQYAIVPVQFDDAWPSVPLYTNDQIQIGYQGFWYNVAPPSGAVLVSGANVTLNSFNPSTTGPNAGALVPTTLNLPGGKTTACFFVYLDVSHGEQPLAYSQSVTAPYKIRRWPMKTGSDDLQLPTPTVIDLTWSGHDPVNAADAPTWPIPTTSTPPIIMFAPDGTVDRNYLQTPTGYNGVVPVTPVYLMVGLRNKVYDNHSDPNIANTNLNDFNSLWVSIDAATGLITVADPAAIGTTSAVLPTPPSNAPDSRANARQSSANVGGK